MIVKKKLCGNCNSLQYIWSNKNGTKLCKQCSSKSKPVVKKKQYSIPVKSDKRKKLDIAYKILRETYLKQHPKCMFDSCLLSAIEIHHKYSGKDRSKYYLDTLTWMSICRVHHDWIHEYSKEARELGLLM